MVVTEGVWGCNIVVLWMMQGWCKDLTGGLRSVTGKFQRCYKGVIAALRDSLIVVFTMWLNSVLLTCLFTDFAIGHM